MSDNVVLSKHFDSLASAIQRCLSAGYAPTAYIPTGKASVLDTVPATVDGGLWYEIEDGSFVIKAHDRNGDIKINSTPATDIRLVVDLHGQYHSDTPYVDLCGGTWTPTGSVMASLLIPYNGKCVDMGISDFYYIQTIYCDENASLARDCDFTLGGGQPWNNFTINFWTERYASTSNNYKIKFYNASETEVMSVYSTSNGAPTDQAVFVLKVADTEYPFTTNIDFYNPGMDAVHIEFGYDCSGKLSCFCNGQLISTVDASIASMAINKIVVGGSSTPTTSIGELKIYNGIKAHAADFTPIYDGVLIG